MNNDDRDDIGFFGYLFYGIIIWAVVWGTIKFIFQHIDTGLETFIAAAVSGVIMFTAQYFRIKLNDYEDMKEVKLLSLNTVESITANNLREFINNSGNKINSNYSDIFNEYQDTLMYNADKYKLLLTLKDKFSDENKKRLFEQLENPIHSNTILTNSITNYNDIQDPSFRKSLILENLLSDISRNYQFNLHTQAFSPSQAYESLMEEFDTLKKDFNNDFAGTQIGFLGEENTLREMKKQLFKGTILEDIRLELDNEEKDSANPDFVYVGPNGVFCMEVKNYATTGNYDVHITEDGQWNKIDKHGNRESIKSVTSQIVQHRFVFSTFINQKLKEKYGENAPEIEIENFIIFANDNVNIKNESKAKIMRTSMIHENIKQFNAGLSDELQRNIVEIIEKYKLKPKKYPVVDYSSKLNIIKRKVDRLLAIIHDYQHVLETIDNTNIQTPTKLNKNFSTIRTFSSKAALAIIDWASTLYFIALIIWTFHNGSTNLDIFEIVVFIIIVILKLFHVVPRLIHK